METRRYWSVLCAVLVTLVLTGGAGAQSTGEEARLEEIRKSMDRQTEEFGRSSRVETLSKRFAYPADGIKALRNGKRGWGEIAIQLSLAERLASNLAEQLHESNPDRYPAIADAMPDAMSEAIGRVGALRHEGIGWENVARMLGLKLGLVVSGVERVRQELQPKTAVENAHDLTAAKPASVETDREQLKAGKSEQMEKAERVEKPERPEKVIRPETLEPSVY